MEWKSVPRLIEDASASPSYNGKHHWIDDLPPEAQERLDLVLKRKTEKRVERKKPDYPVLCEHTNCFVILKTEENRTMHETLHREGLV